MPAEQGTELRNGLHHLDLVALATQELAPEPLVQPDRGDRSPQKKKRRKSDGDVVHLASSQQVPCRGMTRALPSAEETIMTLLARVGRLFPRNLTVDSVQTRAVFDVPADEVWRQMMFYEEVPGRPSWLLRSILPAPVRTSGEKSKVGSLIACVYTGGSLEKRITAVEPPDFISFDVLVQDLGIEDSITMTGGSYQILARANGAEIVLTTLYRGHVRPRWLLRPVERFVARRLHRHILDGMTTAVVSAQAVVASEAAHMFHQRAEPARLADAAAT